MYESKSFVSLTVSSQSDGDREFKTDDDRVLQSRASTESDQNPDTDDNVEKPSHGTRVASKAVGKKLGLAKEIRSCHCTASPLLLLLSLGLLCRGTHRHFVYHTCGTVD